MWNSLPLSAVSGESVGNFKKLLDVHNTIYKVIGSDRDIIHTVDIENNLPLNTHILQFFILQGKLRTSLMTYPIFNL